jgi:hypothetical protein
VPVIVECQECRASVEAHEAGSFERFASGSEPSALFTLLSCLNCGAPILIKRLNLGNLVKGDKWDRPRRLFPAGELHVNPNAPVNVKLLFEEASAYHRAREYTTAFAMCRKTLMEVAAIRKLKATSLGGALCAMRDADLIDDRLFEWWTSLPFAGADGKEIFRLPLSKSEAEDALEFTAAFLDYIFSYRDRFEHFRKRQARVAAAAK